MTISVKVTLNAALAVSLLGMSAGPYPKCTQDHPGRSHRAESLAKRGDSRMGLSAARHSVRYAMHRYGIRDIVTEADIERADKDMYEFLKWKSGSASLLAAQWLTAGYQHYDSHADEAAASLLGYSLPGPQNQLQLPKELTAWIKGQVDSSATESNSEICSGMFSGEGSESGNSTTPGTQGSTAPSNDQSSGGGLGGFICTAVVELARQAANRFYDRLAISGDMLMGQNKFDIKDEVIARLEDLRRNPPPTPTATTGGGAQPQIPTNIRLPGRLPVKR